MADWLRPVFSRTRTPVQNLSTDSAEPAISVASASTDNTGDLAMSRLRPSSRVSSYIGFRPATPPTVLPDDFSGLKDPVNTYQRPYGDEMAETLKVVMMTQSCLDPVPIRYNGCILHVLEAYQDLRGQVKLKQDAIEDLKLGHYKDIQEFESLATRWEAMETEYKVEIKRLEIMLSKTEGGMETVSIARSNSMIHGSERISETIGRGLKAIKQRNAARSPPSNDTQIMTSPAPAVLCNPAAEPDVKPTDEPKTIKRSNVLTQVLPVGKSSATSFYARILRPQGSATSFNLPDFMTRDSKATGEIPSRSSLPIQAPVPAEKLPTKSTLDKLETQGVERRQAEEETGVAFGSSSSASSDSFCNKRPLGNCSRGDLGSGLNEKPLPDIPKINQKDDRFRPRTRKSTSNLLLPKGHPLTLEHSSQQHMSFSFQPGDDSIEFNQAQAHDLAKRRLLDPHLRERNSSAILRYSIASSTASFQPESTSTIDTKPLSSVSAVSQAENLVPQISDAFLRDDSVSNIVTAARKCPGRNCVSVSRKIGPHDLLPQLKSRINTDSGSGSSEAVTAAAKAMAKRISTPSSSASKSSAGG